LTGEILVGKKHLMTYVTTCVSLFSKGTQTITVKARGNLISKAVDVVEVLRRRILEGVEIQRVEFGSETFTGKGRKKRVSTIAITITKRP